MTRRENLILDRDRFDSLRQEKGYSLEKLARAADVSMSTVAAVSRGATVGEVCSARIAAALGVAESDLWLTYEGLARAHG